MVHLLPLAFPFVFTQSMRSAYIGSYLTPRGGMVLKQSHLINFHCYTYSTWLFLVMMKNRYFNSWSAACVWREIFGCRSHTLLLSSPFRSCPFFLIILSCPCVGKSFIYLIFTFGYFVKPSNQLREIKKIFLGWVLLDHYFSFHL